MDISAIRTGERKQKREIRSRMVAKEGDDNTKHDCNRRKRMAGRV